MPHDPLSHDALQSQLCAVRLKALGEPLRLRLIDVLRGGPRTVGQLAELLQTELVTVSHHLGILKQTHLVCSNRKGRFIEYSLPKGLCQKSGRRSDETEFLNLGCCRLEIPKSNA